MDGGTSRLTTNWRTSPWNSALRSSSPTTRSRPAELAIALEERGFELAVGGGALAHPGAAAHASARRRRAGEALL